MKDFGSARSEVEGRLDAGPAARGPAYGLRFSSSVRDRAVYAVAAVWFVAHLPFLAPALEDIDSINFALGLHHYDPALHQPHPPGYPVYIALGRLALALIHGVAPGLAYVRADALALAIWSAVGGALAIVAAGYLFRDMTANRERAGAVGFWGATFLALTPLFWMTGLRPMSDMLGLGVALAAQALILRGSIDGRGLVAGAALAGLAAGIRTQTVPLTLPLLAYALFAQRRRGVWLIRPLAALAAGGVVWAVPLLVVTGGVSEYLRALGSQAGEDFAWADMLWAHPTPRAIAFALYDTFLLPFANPVTGAILLAIAALGMLRMLVVDRRAFVVLVIGYVPYAIFHLLFQEPAMLRYATPLVVPIVFAVAFLVCSLESRLAPLRKLPTPNVFRSTNSQALASAAVGRAVSGPPFTSPPRVHIPRHRRHEARSAATHAGGGVLALFAATAPSSRADGPSDRRAEAKRRMAGAGGLLAEGWPRSGLVPRGSETHGPRAHRSAGSSPSRPHAISLERGRPSGADGDAAARRRLVSARSARLVRR
jgi:hypothetical protein